MYIVPMKDKQLFSTFAVGREKVFSVGNSIKSDIVPSLDAELNAIYIPLETRAYERDHNGVPENERLLVLPSIEKIIEIYSAL